MRAWTLLAASLALGFGTIVVIECLAQEYEVANRPTDSRSIAAGKQQPRFTFIVFSKQQDTKTQQFHQTFQAAAEKRTDRANFAAIDVRDPANQQTVAHYGVSRAPMPLAICVAENGAVTGVFMRQPNDQAIERALVTPAMTEATKALQDKKIVVVHVKQSPEIALPVGAAQFVSDPDFAARTTVIDVVLNDPAEARFVKDMEINPGAVSGSTVVIMAPPAALVGKFAGTATREEIVTKLHAAGKCCNDPNCKHNQKTK
jgi:hypothetical protein